jgi:ribose/xylose/arabinose/galactoside ABC-type transport system permease subunit
VANETENQHIRDAESIWHDFCGVAIAIVFSILRPDAFFTIGNFINITRQISLLVIIALGATLVMSVEEFDLSVGALASLGGVIGQRWRWRAPRFFSALLHRWQSAF